MKSWRDRLNTTLNTVNESSLKLKQQLAQAQASLPSTDELAAAAAAAVGTARSALPAPTASSEAASPVKQDANGEQQYLRLPVESAKKLRWFDRQDINMLMTLHLREKQELFEANSALRQVLRRRGVADAAVDAELALINRQVDEMRLQEHGVNQVLVLAAQAEVDTLKEALDSAHHEIRHMRRHRLQAASSGGLPLAAAAAAAGPAGGGGGERVALTLRCLEGEGGEARVEAALALLPEDGAAGGQGMPSLPAALAALAQGGSAGVGVDPLLLQQAAAALAQLARAQGVTLPGLSAGAAVERSASAAEAAGGDAAEPPAAGGDLQAQCIALQLQVGRLQAELEAAQHDAAYARDAAERKQQEMRGRFAEAQQRQSEMLRLAQDGRLDAESRCEAAERKLHLAEARCGRLEGEVRDAKADAKRAHQEAKRAQQDLAAAEARVQAAEAATQRARGAAEVDAKSHELVAQLRGHVAELEAAAQQHARQLAAAHHQAEALESRLASAELTAARSAAEVHELEEVVHERNAMAVRLSMMEARLDETRAERGQAESYRTLAQQSEEKRARVEDELLTTARLASALEARLVAAARDNEDLRLEVQAAAARVMEAQRSVPRLLQERWAAAGADRSQWPLIAQEEIENVEARLAALQSALKEAQAQLAEASSAAESHRTARLAAERNAAAAEDGAARRQREAEQRAQRAEAAASAAAVQLAEFREALAAAERERDSLLAEKQDREKAARHAAAAVAGARRRTGSGGLQSAGAAAGGGGADGALRRQSSEASLPSPLPTVKQRDTLESTDVLYLKNVTLKFIDACLSGRTQECEVLLPAVATLLRASPAEYRVLLSHLQRGGAGSWLPALPALMGGS
ncbi:zinc ion binding [Micractinium conductrix]|uniref:Zinc ion binding n=1 Tax=Micractinium conductrix TaxID=554055 RepID=A0A2P6VLE3_9CHLO|nr:zinc ion binding [Micractinium conductrix]|eukprot:PSC74921.1 zinc ion binding [Micractinium conductrix]